MMPVHAQTKYIYVDIIFKELLSTEPYNVQILNNVIVDSVRSHM